VHGLDPHDPVFRRDRCYPWKLWNCVVAKERVGTAVGMDVYIKTPMTSRRSGWSQSLKRLLAYHYFGHVDDPTTSSRAQCPCGSLTPYGKCCFPTIRMSCHVHTGFRNCGLCINPMHFVAGTNADPPEGGKFPETCPVLRPCAPCDVCSWTPYEFAATDRLAGYHEGACESSLILNNSGASVVQGKLDQWRHEALRNGLRREQAMCKKGDGDSRACKHARKYLLQQYGDRCETEVYE